MTTLLNVQSSPALSASASRTVSKAFIDHYLGGHPDTELVELDLVVAPPCHIGPQELQAFFSPEVTPEISAALVASDRYVEQLENADIVVLGTPMHNFGVASSLKSWIDHILRVGKTFHYTENGPVGMMQDKPVVIVVSSGSVYSDGPMSQFEHCASYLRDILAIIGLRNVSVLRAEGLAYGPEAAENAIAQAMSQAQDLATRLH